VPLDLKSTLNLPKTDFSMKANLPKNEPKMLERWEQMRLYERIRQAHKGQPIYVMHDGPPYANGPIHLGTALNKTLKDFVVKSRSMSGFDAPYVPGWDCHGLPIEIKVDDQLGRKKNEMDPLAVREECRKYATKYLDLQRSQFKRLGGIARWDEPYSTMNPQYESVVLDTFYKCYREGLVYKGLKSVYWCVVDKTALAEAEVEYEMHTSPSIWVRYALTSDPAKIDAALAGKKNVATIIWTTTPWTLPASMAVTFAPDAEYVALDTGDWIYIVAKALAQQTIENCKLSDGKEIASFLGAKLEHTEFAHPFLGRKILGVLGDYVTMDTGTGAVHTAPAHGADDFNTGVKYGLDLHSNVDDGGILHNGLPEYEGKQVFKANPLIVELLKSRGVLLGYEKIEHSYPHCWRCHNPIIFRATEQWFISMEGKLPEGGTLRSLALDEIKKVKWDPSWGEERISNMVAGRPDWCISRQRVWGVPIAMFQCEVCKEFVGDPAVHQLVVDLFAREGADAWYKYSPEQMLPAGTRCGKCGSTEFRKEMDIVDVWFESGSSQAAVLGHEPGLPWPADLYIEGGDQHRGWFQSSLLCAVATKGAAPYRSAATVGWVLDPQGRAQSKSLGNVVDPVEIADKMGAEIVRLWVASVDFREDVMSSDELMQRVADIYRKIRNTFRYILGNLDGFDPTTDAVPFAEMQSLDQYILLRAAEVTKDVREHYDAYVFHRLYQGLKDFCIVDLSAIYFDVLKDRLYTQAPKSVGRRSAQTALWQLGEALVRLLAPVMSFTADEIWTYLPGAGRSESVHLEHFPAPTDLTGTLPTGFDAAALKSDWQTLLLVRDEALKALEAARNEKRIGGSLEAEIRLGAPGSFHPVLERYQDQLRYLFIVSNVVLEKAPASNGGTGLTFEVSKAPGQKCERCWNYSTHVGEDKTYPTVCERCSAVLAEIEASTAAR
jgi:isoleucyl-tRNA synthetase